MSKKDLLNHPFQCKTFQKKWEIIDELAERKHWRKFRLGIPDSEECDSAEVKKILEFKTFEKCFQHLNKYVVKVHAGLWYESRIYLDETSPRGERSNSLNEKA